MFFYKNIYLALAILIISISALASETLDISIIGKTQIDKDCYFTFKIYNQSSNDLNQINFEVLATNSYNLLLGQGALKVSNIKKGQNFTYATKVPLQASNGDTSYLCKNITNVIFEINHCNVKNSEKKNYCHNIVNIKDSIVSLRTDKSLIINKNYTSDYIKKLKIKVEPINKELAKKYIIKNHKSGLIVIEIEKKEKFFKEGDLLLEFEMLPLTTADSLKKALGELYLNNNNYIINLLREGKEMWLSIN